MPTNSTRSLSDIRADLDAAKRQLTGLQRERESLPAEIKASLHRDREAKVAAARRGETVKDAGDSELTELRAREADLPAELWGARLNVLEFEAEASELRERELRAEAPEAQSELDAAQAAYREAEARVKTARQRAAEVDAQVNHVRRRAHGFRVEAAELEKRGPDA